MQSEKLIRFLPLLVFIVVGSGGFLLFALLHAFLPPELSNALSEIRSESLPIIVLSFSLPAGLAAWICHYLIHSRILPVGRMADASTLLVSGRGRITLEETGIAELDRLRSGLIQAAESLQSNKEKLGLELERASQRLRSERDTLATIISQLKQGVVVTNRKGRVLLFNNSADALLSFPKHQPPVYLGLGRPVEGLIDSSLTEWAMAETGRRQDGEPVPFITLSPGDRLLSVRVLRTSGTRGEDSGYIFFLSDITDSRFREGVSQRFADNGLRRIRDSIAGIQAAADNLKNFPEATPQQRLTFHELILSESERIGGEIKAYEDEEQKSAPAEVSMTLINTEVLTKICMEMSKDARLHAESGDVRQSMFVLADTFTLPVSMAYLGTQIQKVAGQDEVIRFSAGLFEKYVRFSWGWEKGEVTEELLEDWLSQKPAAGRLRLPHSLDEVLSRHRANWWVKETDEGRFELSVILPQQESPEAGKVAGKTSGFDIGLFQTQGDESLLLQPLEKLNATVFDTETTGLNPSDGDKLISVGAVRIVNGSLIETEFFNEFINPGRSVPEASTLIHGITDDMLVGKPDAGRVLPGFDVFTADSLLVAHNAAFDMRFLELEHPGDFSAYSRTVLDTLLLSTVLHPRLKGHSVDDLAKRFDVKSETRHDALGDAITTARIFVKMIPLLKEAGIVTVGDAIRASRESLYSKLKY